MERKMLQILCSLLLTAAGICIMAAFGSIFIVLGFTHFFIRDVLCHYFVFLKGKIKTANYLRAVAEFVQSGETKPASVIRDTAGLVPFTDPAVLNQHKTQ